MIRVHFHFLLHGCTISKVTRKITRKNNQTMYFHRIFCKTITWPLNRLTYTRQHHYILDGCVENMIYNNILLLPILKENFKKKLQCLTVFQFIRRISKARLFGYKNGFTIHRYVNEPYRMGDNMAFSRVIMTLTWRIQSYRRQLQKRVPKMISK